MHNCESTKYETIRMASFDPHHLIYFLLDTFGFFDYNKITILKCSESILIFNLREEHKYEN